MTTPNSPVPPAATRRETDPAASAGETLLLAIDSSTAVAGLALIRGDAALLEISWRSVAAHTVELAPRLRWLLGETHTSPRDLGAIAVCLGPGSYNGLRAGISMAKGLAFALGVPILGISGLETVAHQASAGGAASVPVCALQPAAGTSQRGLPLVAAALFRAGERGLHRERAEQIVDLAELCGWLVEPTLVCGELTPELRREIQTRRATGAVARLAPPLTSQRRPLAIAELALRRMAAGEADDAAALQPLYLRPPNITAPKAVGATHASPLHAAATGAGEPTSQT